MKRIAIMQPYIFPYVGYFQMIKAVDVFIFYDDVNFIKRGWINRNRILLNGKDHLITVPLENSSQNKLINETKLARDTSEIKKLIKTIEAAYLHAPNFGTVMPIISEAFSGDFTYINELAQESVRVFCEYLGISTHLKSSTNQYRNEHLKKADRLIDICHQEAIVNYINAPGGMDIYSKELFAARGINLSFIKSKEVIYKQNENQFVPWLSIIDLAMFNNKEKINEFLNAYELI